LGDANGDIPSLKTIGDKFRDEKPDLIIAVGTQALVNMYNTNPNTPIVFNATTNPFVALKDVVKTPTDHGNVTGVQALAPIKEALEYAKIVAPNAKNIGLVWTTSEQNSAVNTDIAKQEAPGLGLTIVEAPISKREEVQQAAQSIADKVDVFFSTTDVSVVDQLEALVQVAIAKKKPVISNDPSSGPRGVALAYGIDYYNNGVSSAKLASRILNGEAASKVDIEKEKDFGLVVNLEGAQLMGVKLPDAILSKASVKYDKITPNK
jgi:putative ABC transport system substrate-binding protein